MPLDSPGPVPVGFEIHWGLAQERRYRVKVTEVLARSVPHEVAGRRILRLDDHDAAAHLLLHHLQHYFDRRLKWALEQVLPGVTASFLTTLCVLGPLAFLDGDIGKVLYAVPVVLTLVLAVSLVEAFLILPGHLAHAQAHAGGKTGALQQAVERAVAHP